MFSRNEERKQEFFRYSSMLLGAAILSFGLYNIHSRGGVTEGGVLGMTLLLHHWFGISPAVSGFLMDMACYLVGYKFLGTRFAKNAVVASCGFAFFYSVYERFPPLLPSFTAYPLLEALLGGCFVGVGVGLVVRAGGASGGDDALALALCHVTKWRISRAYLLTDLIVLTLSLSYIPGVKIAYSLVTVMLSSFIIELLQRRAAPESLA